MLLNIRAAPYKTTWLFFLLAYAFLVLYLLISNNLHSNSFAGVSFFMFSTMLMLLSLGIPVAFALGSVAIISALIFKPSLVSMLLYEFKGFTYESGKTLVAIPLFIFMGLLLHHSGIAKDLFKAVHVWSGRLRGGLGVGTVMVCALMAAMIGVSSAATISMGIIAVPAMLAHNYDKKLAVGIVQASGALGFLIPPSIMMIMYAFIAQESVGRLFAAGIIPGIMLASIYMIYILAVGYFKPSAVPVHENDETVTLLYKISLLKHLVLPIAIVGVVLGSIFFGVASPTEGAAIGAIGALICALMRKGLDTSVLKKSLSKTLSLTSFNAYIIIGAMAFSSIYSGLGASSALKEFIVALNVDPLVVVLIMQLSFFIFGMFLDDIAILFLSMPIYVPIIEELGLSPIWFAVLFVMNMQMAYITPPYGLNLFYMKSVAPKEVSLTDIYKAVTPFIILQAIALFIVFFFPSLVLWLPSFIFDYLVILVDPETIFTNLSSLKNYPSLVSIFIENPSMTFDIGNFTSIANNPISSKVLMSSVSFNEFLLYSDDFRMLLNDNRWMSDFKLVSSFLEKNPGFLK